MNEIQSNPSSQSMNQEEETMICVNMRKYGREYENQYERKKENEAERKRKKRNTRHRSLPSIYFIQKKKKKKKKREGRNA
mmetsp:Transcript_27455/g.29969  ORF Transcript_27455/g.29969 Transcript_27455/m.29969 type:complete len:80 (-) Transcript_27455:20-259(-)